MTATETTAIVNPLRTARQELTSLNRTVTHVISLASDGDLLTDIPHSQHTRRPPWSWGHRRDAFFWDAWDRSIRGEDDMHRFFEIAERIGGLLAGLEETDAAGLLPGSVPEVNGSYSNLFLPDYWLFIVHHLGMTGQLPYERRDKWSHGQCFNDDPFAVVSRLPVNVVQASIDALTVLIDAAVPFEWSPGDYQFSSLAGVDSDSNPIAPLRLETACKSAGNNGRRLRKRAERATNIEALTNEMRHHIRDARDHAQSAVDHGKTLELLPRPSRRELGERVGLTETGVSRCFNDPAAKELNLLWQIADDLDAVLKYVRQ